MDDEKYPTKLRFSSLLNIKNFKLSKMLTNKLKLIVKLGNKQYH